jgi:hypothetical protein
MSDIQEEQKRLYKRAEENDRTDTISIQDLFNERVEQNKRVEELVNINEKLSLALESAEQRIDKATNYINENWGHWCSNHCKYATETINILKGKE